MHLCFFLLLIRNGHLEIVQFLVNGNHCQVNDVNCSGWTALHYAAQLAPNYILVDDSY